MKYSILVKKRAEKELASLPQKEKEKIVAAIDGFYITPFPQNTKKLSGQKNRW